MRPFEQERVSEVAVRVGVPGSDADRLAELRDGFVDASELLELGRERGAPDGVRGLPREAVAVPDQGFLGPPGLHEGGAQLKIGIRVVRPEAHGLAQPGYRFLGLVLVSQNAPEAVEPVDVGGVDADRLLQEREGLVGSEAGERDARPAQARRRRGPVAPQRVGHLPRRVAVAHVPRGVREALEVNRARRDRKVDRVPERNHRLAEGSRPAVVALLHQALAEDVVIDGVAQRQRGAGDGVGLGVAIQVPQRRRAEHRGRPQAGNLGGVAIESGERCCSSLLISAMACSAGL